MTDLTDATAAPIDPKIIEKAADAIKGESCTCSEGRNQYGYWRRTDRACPACGDSEAKARAALAAVADDLRAEGAVKALRDFAATDARTQAEWERATARANTKETQP